MDFFKSLTLLSESGKMKILTLLFLWIALVSAQLVKSTSDEKGASINTEPTAGNVGLKERRFHWPGHNHKPKRCRHEKHPQKQRPKKSSEESSDDY